MNSINFVRNDNRGLPLIQEMMDFLQNMIMKTADAAAAIAGDCILSGCEVDSNNNYYISEGLMVLGGELAYFPGSYLEGEQKLKIKETKLSMTVSGNAYPEVYVKREVGFAEDGEYEFGTLHNNRIITNMAIRSRLEELETKAIPEAIGSVKIFYCPQEHVPYGWKRTTGTSLWTADYPELAEMLGHSEDDIFALPVIDLVPSENGSDPLCKTYIKAK
jgi:hypothetical protein